MVARRTARDLEQALSFRDALHEWDHVQSELMTRGETGTEPLVSLVLPTYRRPRFLSQAVRSIIAQDFNRPFEIVVVDNDPESQGHRHLLEQCPELAGRNVRYFRNEQNIGMFGNFNRCLQLARGEWTSILNDDDMLDPDFLTTMFAAIDHDPKIDGIICQKRMLYESTTIQAADRSSARQLAKRALLEALFQGKATRKVTPRKLFWGLFVGNSAGFLFRTQVARHIGGFYAEEKGSADYWFTTRFAALYQLRQHRAVAATTRVAENETGEATAAMGQMQFAHALRMKLLGTVVPRSWRRLLPMLVARDRVAYRESWAVNLAPEELKALLNVPTVKDRPYLLWTIKLLLRGY